LKYFREKDQSFAQLLRCLFFKILEYNSMLWF